MDGNGESGDATGNLPDNAPDNRASGYPHLALCILDAVWTVGVSAATVRKVVSRYCAFAELSDPLSVGGQSAAPEPLRRFVEAIERDGPEGFAGDALQNRQRTLRANGILKADAAYRVAVALHSRGVAYPPEVASLQNDSDFETAFRAIPGLGPAAWERLFALCGLGGNRQPATGNRAGKLKRILTVGVSAPSPVRSPSASPSEGRGEPVTGKTSGNEFPNLGSPLPSEGEGASTPEAQTKKERSASVSDAQHPTLILRGAQETEHPPLPDLRPPTPDPRYTVRIQEMPSDERPRERLAQYGAEALGHAELIAILLRTGTEKYNAVQVAERLLADFDGLRGVAQMTVQELGGVHGIGLAKAAQIKAAIELGRRLVAESPDSRYRIRGPQDVYNLLGPRLRDEKREHFIALLLDAKGGVMRQETISIGDLSSSIVNPREVFRPAVRHSASSLIVAHNHPSGDPSPSPEDIAVTKLLIEAGKLLSVDLLDHIILGDNRFLSLKERNLI